MPVDQPPGFYDLVGVFFHVGGQKSDHSLDSDGVVLAPVAKGGQVPVADLSGCGDGRFVGRSQAPYMLLQ